MSVCLLIRFLFVFPLPCHFFCVDWGGAAFVHGLVQSVPRPRVGPLKQGGGPIRFFFFLLKSPLGGGGDRDDNWLSAPFFTAAEKNIGLLSASVETFGVSRMRDFFIYHNVTS